MTCSRWKCNILIRKTCPWSKNIRKYLSCAAGDHYLVIFAMDHVMMSKKKKNLVRMTWSWSFLCNLLRTMWWRSNFRSYLTKMTWSWPNLGIFHPLPQFACRGIRSLLCSQGPNQELRSLSESTLDTWALETALLLLWWGFWRTGGGYLIIISNRFADSRGLHTHSPERFAAAMQDVDKSRTSRTSLDVAETSYAHGDRNPPPTQDDMDLQKRKEAVEKYKKLAQNTGWRAQIFHLNFFRVVVLHVTLTSLVGAGIIKGLCPNIPFIDCYYTAVSAITVCNHAMMQCDCPCIRRKDFMVSACVDVSCTCLCSWDTESGFKKWSIGCSLSWGLPWHVTLMHACMHVCVYVCACVCVCVGVCVRHWYILKCVCVCVCVCVCHRYMHECVC